MRFSMKYFYIVTNRFKDPDGVNTRKIAHFLRSKGAECVCQIEQEVFPTQQVFSECFFQFLYNWQHLL